MTSALFTLACDDDDELATRIDAFRLFFARRPERPLGLVVHNVAEATRSAPSRIAVVADDLAGLDALLAAGRAGQRRPDIATGQVRRTPRLLWLFPGHGLMAPGAGLRLLAEPAFAASLAETADAVERTLGAPAAAALRDLDQAPQNAETVQLRTFALQSALAALWRDWGVEPDVVIGHSLGEVAAAHVAGALSLDDAVRIVGLRGRLLDRIRGQGGMIAVDRAPDRLASLLDRHAGSVGIAAVNGRRDAVLSGDLAPLEALAEQLKADGATVQWLADVAGHSHQVDPLAAELVAALQGIASRSTRIAIHSCVTGGAIDGAALDAAYWGENLRRTVRFADALDGAIEGVTAVLELGAQAILSPAVEADARRDKREIAVLPSLRRGRDERTAMLRAAARLWTDGVALRLDAINRTVPR